MDSAVVVLELNELSPPLIDRFIAEGKLPAFQRLRSESIAYVTEAEETQGHLEPWIQWVTAHTGVGFDEHGIFTLGDGNHLEHETIADVTAAAGRDVWLCSPMNVVPTRPVRGWWLPDPWNPSNQAQPAELAAFGSFVRTSVQEHTAAVAGAPPAGTRAFATFMVRHGLSPATVWATLRQLVGERLRRRERWQRAALLDRFQWDLFRHHQRRGRPALSTYFSNTTAHYQHVYWRHMDPGPFVHKPTEEERARFGQAIESGYREMDRLVAESVDLVERQPNTTLVLCTALSQQPFTRMEESGGKFIYHPVDLGALLARLGIEGVTQVAPVMAEQFHVYFEDEAAAARAEGVLRSVEADGRPAIALDRSGADLFLGCALLHDLGPGTQLRFPDGDTIPFFDAFYRSETSKSGFHHSEGAFWVRTPDRRGAAVDQRVPLRCVAPTILRLLDLEPPASMSAPALPTTVEGLDEARLPEAASA